MYIYHQTAANLQAAWNIESSCISERLRHFLFFKNSLPWALENHNFRGPCGRKAHLKVKRLSLSTLSI